MLKNQIIDDDANTAALSAAASLFYKMSKLYQDRRREAVQNC